MEYFFVGVCSVPHMDEPAMLAVSPFSAAKKRKQKSEKTTPNSIIFKLNMKIVPRFDPTTFKKTKLLRTFINKFIRTLG